MGYKPIEDYGLIGDMHTAALVGKDGSIDFLCLPHFDSPSVFAAILDDEKGGRFAIEPLLDGERTRQFYLPDSNVLMTHFYSMDALAEILDYMCLDGERGCHTLVRQVRALKGEITFRLRCEPRFNYARSTHQVERKDGEAIFISDGPDKTALRLSCSTPFEIRDGDAFAEFTLAPDEKAVFVLDTTPERESPLAADDFAETSFQETNDFWRGWISQSTYRGRWLEHVNRSALTLKMLIDRTHGSMVAAPTFSLPGWIGGDRNFDYRFTWIRDASFALYALIRLGFTEETRHFIEWLENVCCAGDEGASLKVLYNLDGSHKVKEQELPHLEGYKGSKPVRIGNAAAHQQQLDIYGALIDSIYLYNKYGEPIGHATWQRVTNLVNEVRRSWKEGDPGIWEGRRGDKHFLSSKLMSWVALDRGVRLALKRSFPAPLNEWIQTRDEIYNYIWKHLWSEELQSFVQFKGGSQVDGSLLLMPLMKFVGPKDPNWLSSLKQVDKQLVTDIFVRRFIATEDFDDGFDTPEGYFTICSFWYVECLSRAGQLNKARLLFEKNLQSANHLGLFAEELGPCGEHLGNFPQAYTHLALISAAFDLNRRLSEGG